jgi:FixJ family two-component response regulator
MQPTVPPPSRPCVLLLEDDAGVRRSLHLLLRAHGFDVRSHASARRLFDDLGIGEAQFLIADYQLGEDTGINVLRALRAAGWMRRAILVTAYPSATVTEAARAQGYDAVLEKPVDPRELLRLVGVSPESVG